MPRPAPATTPRSAEALAALGVAVRRRRKALGISAVATAEAAGLSRPTLHRIEKGEPSVTMGAYLQVMVVLGLDVTLKPREQSAASANEDARRAGWLPARVHIADYPWLKQLAWQVHGPQALTPREALGIYERNWRHLDPTTLSLAETDLLDALRVAFGNDAGSAPVV